MIRSPVLMLAMNVPPAVELPEGGTAEPAVVRVRIARNDPGYETLTIRGELRVGAEDVVVPVFGGELDTEVVFDLGEGRSSRCTLR